MAFLFPPSFSLIFLPCAGCWLSIDKEDTVLTLMELVINRDPTQAQPGAWKSGEVEGAGAAGAENGVLLTTEGHCQGKGAGGL